ncbi:hypothetical protein BOX37_26600 [Nocardia mangyaensis]|uniref:Uncharacterized protein n=1 Tax=Nocardia mangyaensis TaxID=2213200 RepID=A0A1J0VXU9_9NOCA|nr:hypothetical protein [Nocardia mangyaensis]APE36912.1 hypothetical protein BOX37_26600 [Nocardia mangyaensis]
MAAELTDEQVTDLEERLFALLAEKSEEKSEETGDKNFWTVELVRPPGGSTGLLAYIAMAEAAIQSSVNLLGIGTTSPPPNVDELIRPVVYENLGKSESTEEYKETLTKVEARQGALLRADRNVVEVAKYVSSEEDQTLRAIKDIVGELNNNLEAVGKGELKAAQEMNLLRHLAEAVGAVLHKVTMVAELNSELAGSPGDEDDGSGSGGSGSGGGGGGGGDGSLASLLPMLAMLPMAAMPLMTMLPDLVENLSGEDSDDRREPESAPAPDEGPAPADPRTPEAESRDEGPAEAETKAETKAEPEAEPASAGSPLADEQAWDQAADQLGPLGPMVSALGRSVRSALEPAARTSSSSEAAAEDAGSDQPDPEPIASGLTEV